MAVTSPLALSVSVKRCASQKYFLHIFHKARKSETCKRLDLGRSGLLDHNILRSSRFLSGSKERVVRNIPVYVSTAAVGE